MASSFLPTPIETGEISRRINDLSSVVKHNVISLAVVQPTTKKLVDHELKNAKCIYEYDGSVEGLTDVMLALKDDAEIRALVCQDMVDIILNDFVHYFYAWALRNYDTIVLQRTGTSVLVIVNKAKAEEAGGIVDMPKCQPVKKSKFSEYDWTVFNGRSIFLDYSDLRHRLYLLVESAKLAMMDKSILPAVDHAVNSVSKTTASAIDRVSNYFSVAMLVSILTLLVTYLVNSFSMNGQIPK